MESILLILFISLAISTVLNIFLKKLNISHIIGYIITGTIVASIFNLGSDLKALELIAEFGIVFLMFTIGLEMPIEKLKRMKELLLVNGFFQVILSTTLIFLISKFLFNLDTNSSLIISLAFSLSSTAILVFQDLAVIPILLLISFLSNDTLSLNEILLKTFFSALIIIIFMLSLGKKIMTWLLDFSAKSRLEELFLGSVLSIVIGTSILAHELGFTYSLGAFIAGMIIAETKYHIKVESDIASYKDLLLGTFFFSVGTKIDLSFMLTNLHYVFLTLILAMIIKAFIIYFISRRKSNKSDSIKSALALCQIGEFSFAVFALASANSLLDENLSKFLILVTVLSMIITPFIVNNIYKLASYFVTEFYESDKITPIDKKEHTIICGYSMLGRVIAKELTNKNRSFVIISDNLKHVLLARKNGYMAYFGHLEKLPVLESLKVEESSSIIITLSSINEKRLICEAILNFKENANLIVKIDSLDEKKALKELNITHFVNSKLETAKLMVEKS